MNLKAQLVLIGLLALIALLAFPNPCIARRANKDCGSSQCGNLTIRFPFRLKSQPRNCGDPRLELDCENDSNRTVLVIEQGRFYVQNISYSDHTIRFIDPSLATPDNCSPPLGSFPLYSSSCRAYNFDPTRWGFMYIVNCTIPMESMVYVDASRCTTTNTSSSSHQLPSNFYFLNGRTSPGHFNESCTIVARVPTNLRNISGLATSVIYEDLSKGFEISWIYYNMGCDEDLEFSFPYMLSSLRYGLEIYLESFIHYLFKGPHLASDTVNTPKDDSHGTSELCRLAVVNVKE
ncbi:hypothetical protein V6N13_049942 [Hibiscus sabdariffa]